MNKNVLCNSLLFHGIQPDELESMLSCLSAVTKQYKRDSFIYRQGDAVSLVGMVLKGSVHIIKEDIWGSRRILETSGPGQLFGESYACVSQEPLMVSVQAAEDTEVLFLDVARILRICSSACAFHSRLIANLLSVLANKNVILTRKMDHLTQKTIREKLLSYLSYEAGRQGSCNFIIPFNRQQLADYLSVDRSALSAELSKMKKDHLLDYEKNRFSLHV